MVMQINIVGDQVSHALGKGQQAPNTEELSSAKTALALRVSSVLQTTLELEKLIPLFSQQLRPALHHDAIAYHNDQLGINVGKSRKDMPAAHYALSVNDEPLGELVLYRKWEFSKEDSNILEYVLCGLVYPLRNAILYRQAVQAAHKDPLTGVNNRATLDDSLKREISLAQRYKRQLSLVVLDIDHFKRINDSKGHSAGDCVIRAIADLSTSCIRATDMLFRYGGEEFVILCSNTDTKGAKLLAERIRKRVQDNPSLCSGETIPVTVSLGIATWESGEDEKRFFARADRALYQAKSDGRNCVRLAENEIA